MQQISAPSPVRHKRRPRLDAPIAVIWIVAEKLSLTFPLFVAPATPRRERRSHVLTKVRVVPS